MKKAILAQSLQHAGFRTQQEQFLNSISSEVLESSLIENEVFSAEAVRSSIARKLGIDPGHGASGVEKRAEGIIQVLLEATQNFAAPLTEARILGWHRVLIAHDRGVATGEYRTDPVYVGSRTFGKEVVHFEGPPPERVALEMQRFVQGMTELDQGAIHPWLESALAHFWFVTIHPFEDGNGRMARAIAEFYLARADGSSERYYSLSAVLNARRKDYYEALESAQKGTLDVTPWMLLDQIVARIREEKIDITAVRLSFIDKA